MHNVEESSGIKMNVSVYSKTTNLTSILKNYSPLARDKAKNATINNVRFEMPREKGLLEMVKALNGQNDAQRMNDFANFVRETEFDDLEFCRIFRDARKVVHQLNVEFSAVVEALLGAPWTKRSPEAIDVYTEFCIDIMVAYNKYTHFGITKLIALWIPSETDEELWVNGTPLPDMEIELQPIHKLLERLLTVIPMTFDVVSKAIETKFPYYNKAPYVIAGYLHNMLRLLEYKPIFTEFVVLLIMQRLIILDVNAPRSEIEEAEDDDDTDEEENAEHLMDAESIFQMDEFKTSLRMNHPIARTLDTCMEKIFAFFDTKNANALNLSADDKLERHKQAAQFLKALLNAFDNVVLPSHNTHHVQFLIFYYCSFHPSLAESFLISLWNKIRNPNVSAVIRQAAVAYIASFLSRSKFLSISVLKHYLQELCNWAHQYIERSDQYRSNGLLKANLVFYSVCQAIFYVIAFRSRDLTVDKRSLRFLQSLQLSALVTCSFNPLRVCLSAVATAFAGVTRAYQLAYCHAILERNARRKLATVYANDTATPEELLDTFFPFDPCLLKMSGRRISPHYLQYQASEAEEHVVLNHKADVEVVRRKRGDSEMSEIDDFLLIADKRQKFSDHHARSQEREAQFTYGLSPGFHI